MVKQMADDGNHTQFRATPTARAHLAQPRLALGMMQQVGTELRQEQQGRRQCKHARPGLNLGNPCGGKAQLVFGIAKAFLNGMITNDKFCCTRWDILPLSWWRRPKRLRG